MLRAWSAGAPRRLGHHWEVSGRCPGPTCDSDQGFTPKRATAGSQDPSVPERGPLSPDHT
eukprot:9900183-Alexandrium_andersonii.AAC.1